MLYTDGNEARLGDIIAIDVKYRGVVVACIDRGEYSPSHPAAQWAYLERGVVVDTTFGGIVHYEDAKHEHMVLVERGR